MTDLTGNILADKNAELMQNFTGRAKYEIVSMTAYLLGVPKKIFENENEAPQNDLFAKYHQNKNARIIRNLCLLRNGFEQNFNAIRNGMTREYKSLMSLGEYVDLNALQELLNDGISLYKSNRSALEYIVEINRNILNRINNIKLLCPVWLNWEYYKEIFIMPNGLSESGCKSAGQLYCANRSCYPYSVWLNWSPYECGNLLRNDRTFVEQLYEWNEDQFTDSNKVSDVSDFTRRSIYEFLESADKVDFVVDCENSDPYNLCATLQQLPEDMFHKISKIILFDDVHTTPAWEILKNYTTIPIEYQLVERIKEDKSLVDMQLAVRTCREFFLEKVDSFVLVSSDSDYWALVSQVPEAKFLVMVEHEKCGSDIKGALLDSGIYYCFLDDFYAGADSEIKGLKTAALRNAMNRYIEEHVQLNIHEMLNAAIHSARVSMAPAEKRQFLEKHVRPMQMSIDEEGNVVLTLKFR